MMSLTTALIPWVLALPAPTPAVATAAPAPSTPAPTAMPTAAPTATAAALPATAGPVADPSTLTPDEVIARVQGFYDRTLDYTAEFEQVYTYKVYKRKKVSKGKVFFKKPGKMRWEYVAPERRIFVGDGSTLWVYDPAEKSVLKSKMDSSSLPTSITFLMGAGDLRTEFKATLLADHPLASASILVVELVPIRDEGHYKKLHLVVNAKSFMVVRTIVFDPTGNVNDIKFRKAKTDSSIDDAKFTFEIPPGVEVIEGPK